MTRAPDFFLDHVCAVCRRAQTALSWSAGSERGAPEDGDLLVCADCGAILVLIRHAARWSTRVATQGDLDNLTPELRRRLAAASVEAPTFARSAGAEAESDGVQ